MKKIIIAAVLIALLIGVYLIQVSSAQKSFVNINSSVEEIVTSNNQNIYTTSGFEISQLIGMKENEAVNLAIENDIEIRAGLINGKPIVLTADLLEDRLTYASLFGKISAVSIERFDREKAPVVDATFSYETVDEDGNVIVSPQFEAAAKKLIGMSEFEAEKYSVENNFQFRVKKREREDVEVADDFRFDRVSAIVENGVVSGYDFE